MEYNTPIYKEAAEGAAKSPGYCCGRNSFSETHVRKILFFKRKTLSHNPGPQVPLSRQETRRGDRAPFLWSKGKERLHTPHRRVRHRKDDALPRPPRQAP